MVAGTYPASTARVQIRKDSLHVSVRNRPQQAAGEPGLEPPAAVDSGLEDDSEILSRWLSLIPSTASLRSQRITGVILDVAGGAVTV